MVKNLTAPVGVFDSGVGGLTVVLEMLRQMPYESLLYYGDTAHVPYGPREPQELKGFAFSITEHLVKQGCKMVIIACNTSTSLAYEELCAGFRIPIIGVIEPGVDKALETTKNMKVGVIATSATVNSGVYQNLLKQKNPDIDVFAASCPSFVPLVEAGKTEGEQAEAAAELYLRPLVEKGIDTLILGCTHYPFLLSVITKTIGPFVTSVDPARETVSRAKKTLEDIGGLRPEGEPMHRFCSSGDAVKFRKTATVFLGRDIGRAERVCLD